MADIFESKKITMLIALLVSLLSFSIAQAQPEVEWEKTFGGNNDAFGESVQQTRDGGYIIAGDIIFGYDDDAIYLIKTDSNGNEQWKKTFGRDGQGFGRSVLQTNDEGYIIVGGCVRVDDSGYRDTDVYLIKTNSNGTLLWEKTFGGHDEWPRRYDFGRSIQQTNDGGYIIGGGTSSFGAGELDVYLIKTDLNGNKEWEKTFGGSHSDYGNSVQQTNDGGYVIVGMTKSFNAGIGDVYLIKTDSNGNKEWEKTFGGSHSDYGNSVQQTNDGGYVIIGSTESYQSGWYSDAYLIKTDSDGNKEWEKTFGRNNYASFGESVQQTRDEGYIIAGTTSSYGNTMDVWLIKTDLNGNFRWDKTVERVGHDYSRSMQQTSDGGYIIVGYTELEGIDECNIYLVKFSSPKVSISGTIRYENKLFNETGIGPEDATEFVPVRFADVELCKASDNSILAEGETDANGNYTFEIDNPGNEPIFLRCYARQEEGDYRIVVKDNTTNCQIHYMDSEPQILTESSDIINLDITVDSNKAGAFNILDILMKGSDFVKSLNSSIPPLVTIFWEVGTTDGTHYDPSDNSIHIFGDIVDPDEYDDSIILHEYGHSIAQNFSKDDSLGGTHQAKGHYDIRLSWSEGWANFFSCAVRHNSFYIDVGTSTYKLDFETLFHDYYGSLSTIATGQDNEIAVASVLWDIFDGKTESHDMLSLGTAELWDVFANYLTSSYAAWVSLEDFWDGWFELGYSYYPEMKDIFIERSIEFFEDAFENNDTSAIAQNIPLDGTEQHYTYYPCGDEDWVSFSAIAGAKYDIETLNLTNFADTVLELYDGDGITLLDSNDDRNVAIPKDLSSSISWTAPDSGTYFVKFKRYLGSKGPILTEFSDNELYPGVGSYGSYDIKMTTDAPILDPIGDKSITENELLQFTISATDRNEDSLIYSASNLPPGANFDPDTQEFTWTPTYDDAGTYPDIHFEVTDGLFSDSEDITITVDEGNRPPDLSLVPDTLRKEEGETITSAEIELAVDPDGEILSYSYSNWLTSLPHIITYDDAGTHILHIEVSDGSNKIGKDIEVTVSNINRAPVFNLIGNKTVNETIQLIFTVSAIDPDGDSLTYSATNLPLGANFEVSTQTFKWTPTYIQAGIYPDVHFTVTDGFLADSEDITITVHNANIPPVLSSIGNKNINEGNFLQFTISASDPDGDTLICSTSSLPPGASFDSATKTFEWTPTYEQAGVYPGVHFEVSDGSFSDGEDIIITVNNINRPPVLSRINNQVVNEGDNLSLTISAADPDGDVATIEAVGLTSFMNFDGTNFIITPGMEDAGNYQVTFTSSDGVLTDSEIITISVGNVDRPPEFESINNKSLNENAFLTFTVNASDPDGDALIYSASNLPPGASFDPASRTFEWTPTYEQASIYSNVHFEVISNLLADSEDIIITVNNVNRIPTLELINNKSVNENTLLTFTINASDPDKDVLTYSASNLPPGANFDPAIKTFSWTPTYEQAGTYPNIHFAVSDALLIDSEDIAITVNKVNRAPLLDPIANISINEGETVTFNPTASDPDEDILTFSYSNWMTSSTYTTTYDDAGEHIVTVTVSDGNLTDSQDVTVTVHNVNQIPIADDQNLTLDEDTAIDINLTATDLDKDPLVYEIIDQSNCGILSGDPPTLIYTPNAHYNGSDFFTFKANDGRDDSNIGVITLTIRPVNDPPEFAIIGNKFIDEGALLEFQVIAIEQDEDNLTCSVSNLPSGANFTDNGNGTGNFSWVPTTNQVGTYQVEFIVSDATSKDTEIITIMVSDKTAPIINIDPVCTPTNQDVTLTYAISDNYTPQDALIVTGDQSPYTKEGAYNITLRVEDEAGNFAEDSVSFTIDKTPPVINITNPDNNTGVDDTIIDVSGRVDDPSATVEIEVSGQTTNYFSAINNADGTFMASDIYIEGDGQRNIIRAIATDTAGNTAEDIFSVFQAWVLHIDLPQYYAQELLPSPYSLYSSGAATAQMIIDLMRPGDDTPSQLEIYEYGHACNQNSIAEMDPQAMDYALGHFDSYDPSDPDGEGHPNYGYNFGIEAYDADQFKEYLRDITHWMAYPVTKEAWWDYQDESDLVEAPNTPAAVPGYGSYGHWLVVNGAATDRNPFVGEPHSRWNGPWDLSNFMVYGLWLTDPVVNAGIGQDIYLIASDCEDTLLPLKSNDAYNGKYLQVAEPPVELSSAEVFVAEPKINESTQELVRIAEYLSSKADPLEKHLLDRALVVTLDEMQDLVCYNIEQDLLNVFQPDEEQTCQLNWKEIIDPLLLTEEKFNWAIKDSIARNFIPVRRLDKTDKDYYLIPFDKFSGGQFLSFAAIIIDKTEGYFKQASWVERPVRYIQISKDEAIKIVLAQQGIEQRGDIQAELVWSPALSSSPFYPVWRVTIAGKSYYINKEVE